MPITTQDNKALVAPGGLPQPDIATSPESIAKTSPDLSNPLAGPTIVDTNSLRKEVTDATTSIQDVSDREPEKEKEKTLESTLVDLEDIGEQEVDQFEDFQKQLNRASKGGIPLTKDEKAVIAALENELASASEKQKLQNAQRTGFQRRLAGRSGRTRFASELAEQEIAGSIQTGLDELNDLNIKGIGVIAEAKQAIREKNFKNIIDTNDRMNNFLNQRKDTISSIQNSILGIKQEQRDADRFDMDVETHGLNVALMNAELVAAKKALNNPEEDLTPLSGTEQADFHNSFESVRTITRMQELLDTDLGLSGVVTGVGSPEAREFAQLRENLIDILARDRTGAVIGKDEAKSFKKILGVGIFQTLTAEDETELKAAMERVIPMFDNRMTLIDPTDAWQRKLERNTAEFNTIAQETPDVLLKKELEKNPEMQAQVDELIDEGLSADDILQVFFEG